MQTLRPDDIAVRGIGYAGQRCGSGVSYPRVSFRVALRQARAGDWAMSCRNWSEADLLREMIGSTAERLMKTEVGAAWARNRHCELLTAWDWETRAGAIELCISKLRKGSYFSGFLEPRR